jgi:hypothetical protein
MDELSFTVPKIEGVDGSAKGSKPEFGFLCLVVGMMVAAASMGCAGGRRESSDQRPLLFNGNLFRKGTSGSTIGHDLRSAPAGTTIPPAGLGVDLVSRDMVRGGPSSRPMVSADPRDTYARETTGIIRTLWFDREGESPH